MRTIRIGAGAGYSGDRIEPAAELAERGHLDYLVFECLAERTIALAQQARQTDPDAGFDSLLAERFKAVLRPCVANKVAIITNMGAANPIGAARAAATVARDMAISGLKIAAVSGDDVTQAMRGRDLPLIETRGRIADIADRIVSANAYLGAEPIVAALAGGADVVITGRVSDPALFLAPLVHEFQWAWDDWDRLGKGYFADPGYKDVPDLARLGFPLAEVGEDGAAVIGKLPDTGGTVSVKTCKEQLLYELHDPARYYQPDVVADFSKVQFDEVGPDRVAVSGGTGRPRPDTLKVTIGYCDGYVGEGQFSYAGAGARARARLALEIVAERLRLTRVATTELRLEIIGVDSVHRGALAGTGPEPQEARIRVIGRTATLKDAVRIGNEVETLWLNGPAGGGGAWKSAREVIAAVSTLIPRSEVEARVTYEVT
jgi:Acyclic terpene utilisation family protein AtuA